jgi:hypothetical protein
VEKEWKLGQKKRRRDKAENFSQQITKLYISSPAMAELSFFFRTVTFFIRSQK